MVVFQRMIRSISISSRFLSTLKDPSVLDHIVCPISKYPLVYLPQENGLYCREIQVIYPIRDGIPILVPMEGRIVPENEIKI